MIRFRGPGDVVWLATVSGVLLLVVVVAVARRGGDFVGVRTTPRSRLI